MTPTNEQIIAEANRRRQERGKDGPLLVDFIIEVMRENWTPPEPVVDPDLLAFREWLVECRPACKTTASEGDWDQSIEARAYLAGARMAREQERAKVVELEERLKRFETMGHYPPTSTPGPWLLKESDL